MKVILKDLPIERIKINGEYTSLCELTMHKLEDDSIIATRYGYWHGGQTQGRVHKGIVENEPKSSKLYVYYDRLMKNYRGVYDNMNIYLFN